jgi:hypothetical protein
MARWKMLSGKFYFQGNKYIAGDVFEATPSQVKGIRNIIQPLDKIEDYMEPHEEDVPRTKLKAVHKGFGKWDVVNIAIDKAINDRPLNKAEALQLIEESESDLEKEEAIAEAKAVERQKKELAKLEAEKRAIEEEKMEANKVELKKTEVNDKDEVGEEGEDGEVFTNKEETTRSSKAVGKKRRVPIGGRTKS